MRENVISLKLMRENVISLKLMRENVIRKFKVNERKCY